MHDEATPSRYKLWTAQEDAAICRSAVSGWPTLKTGAVKYGRTYLSIRTRASRLRAIRFYRLDPADRPARGPSSRVCRYCGAQFLGLGGGRYCGEECRTLSRGQCPGCGRAARGRHCEYCAKNRKRSDWPVRGQRADAHPR